MCSLLILKDVHSVADETLMGRSMRSTEHKLFNSLRYLRETAGLFLETWSNNFEEFVYKFFLADPETGLLHCTLVIRTEKYSVLDESLGVVSSFCGTVCRKKLWLETAFC